MLIALIAYLFLGGGSGTLELLSEFKEIKTSIKQHVEDSGRREAALKVVNGMIDSAKDFQKMRAVSTRNLVKTIKKHGRNTAEVTAILDKAESDIKAFQQQMLREFGQLKSHLTKEEWALISPW